MKSKTCCFTGHRQIPFYQTQAIKKVLKDQLKKLIAQGVIYFGAGGALGFDTLAAEAVLELRETNPQVKLILVLPCHNQTKGWTKQSKATYTKILTQANKVVYTSQAYTPGCMHKRNRYLVDGSSHCLSYFTKASGGTAYTISYAMACGLHIINLADLI